MSNPYLEGSFAPVTEEVTAFDLAVTGSIPPELDGRYLRNGPNALGIEDPATHLWAVGDGMVHGVRIRGGRAEWYRNRWVRSGLVADKLGEPRRPGPPNAAADFASNTHVISHAGRILALTEGGASPYELDGDLETVCGRDFGGALAGASAAHTKLDPATGELHALVYLMGGDAVEHLVTGPAGDIVGSTVFEVPGGPMVHDFALTERYVLFFDVPLLFDMGKAMAGNPSPYAWHDDRPARIGVLPRAGGEVRWFEIAPCMVFHTLNGYEEGMTLVLDAVASEGPYELTGPPVVPSTLRRWTIDLVNGTAREDMIDDRSQEFPRINESLLSRKHRYGYTTLAGAYGTSDDNGIVKHDLATGTSETHLLKGAVGEPVYVAAGAAEDDGYVLSYTENPDRGASDLLILSAVDFGAEVARVHLPARVPLGFHGNWIPD